MADVFTSVGESLAADYWEAGATWYIGWGTGTTGAAKGDTALETASAESRVATTDSQPAADTNQHVAEITSAGTQTITEMGLFDASTSGNLALRSVFSGISLTSGDKIEFTVQIQWA